MRWNQEAVALEMASREKTFLGLDSGLARLPEQEALRIMLRHQQAALCLVHGVTTVRGQEAIQAFERFQTDINRVLVRQWCLANLFHKEER